MNFELTFRICKPVFCRVFCRGFYRGFDDNNIWLCNKELYEYSTLSYLTSGNIKECSFPRCIFMIPPTDDGYNKILRNISLYTIICRQTREYMLCTYRQLRTFLFAMSSRWLHVLIYPYTGSHSLLYHDVCCYNFAIVDYAQQKDTLYICDPSILQFDRYSRTELKQIANNLNISTKNKTRTVVQQEIYNKL